MIGTCITPDFEIVAPLRTTAFGTVYRARQASLNRDVAIKILEPSAASEKSLARFLVEVQRLAALHHPNVVQVYSLGNHRGTPFVVMELLAGRPLHAVMQEGRLSLRERVRLMTRVARGLQAIHGLGVVHRGLTPNDILVDGPSAKIVDLGLAADAGAISSRSQTSRIPDVASYLAPEQIEGREATYASDVFAFAVILYEFLSGVHPFHAAHPMSVLFNIVQRDPNPMRLREAGVSDPLLGFVMRCLDKDPKNRPQTVVEVEQELALAEAKTGSPAPPGPAPVATSVAPSRQDSRFNPYGSRVMIRSREEFFGRSREVRRIYARLNANPPGSVSVVGDRRIGKSSLLNYVHMQANRAAHLQESDRMVMVFLDLSQWKDLTLEAFAKALVGMAALELGPRLDVADCSHDLEGIRALVERLHKAGYRLAVLLDEFERISNNPSFPLEFFAFLRFLANHYDVAYITSSARHLQTLCHSHEIADSPFFNIFSALHLTAFQRDEAMELIRVPSERASWPLEAHTDRILDLAGRFPFFIQMACWHTLENLDAATGAGQPDFEAIRRAFEQDATPHYQHLWESLDGIERETLGEICRGRTIGESRKHVVEDLAMRGYVEEDAGTKQLFSTPFRDFVARAVVATPAASAVARDRRRAGWAWRPVGLIAASLAIVAVFAVLRPRDRHPVEDDGARGVQLMSAPAVATAPVYGRSYALVIGASNYGAGWPALPGVEADLRRVSDVLRARGFEVESMLDPNAATLSAGLNDFVTRAGAQESDRLVVYFAGHGWTEPRFGEDLGYIVPVDAPDPKEDLQSFTRKALTMYDVQGLARKIRANHALFVFDACFAGSIFTAQRGSMPLYIADQLARPVRQFITSGGAGETVPDKSVFATQFVAGLDGEADYNHDRYVTGSELGQFLYERVFDYTKKAQRPQYGKIRDPNLDKGDFVFTLSPKER